IENGGSAQIEGNHITHIQDPVFGGRQDGFGIEVGRSVVGPGGVPTTGAAEIDNNVIDDYQKGGVVVSNTGSGAWIHDNSVRGAGPTGAIAQNGIEISDGAQGRIEDNCVSGNVFASPTQPAQFAAAGILVFQPDDHVRVEGNTVAQNDVGIWILDAIQAR